MKDEVKLMVDPTVVNERGFHPTYIFNFRTGDLFTADGSELRDDQQRELIKRIRIPYSNHCWNCKCHINAAFARKSSRENGGYICLCCGMDLVDYYQHLMVPHC